MCSYDGVEIFRESCSPPEQFKPDPEEPFRTLLYFSTTNEARTIHWIIGVSVSEESFQFDDLDYARRFARAFKHAVEMCGGKPSKF
jgi:hypothetical protein